MIGKKKVVTVQYPVTDGEELHLFQVKEKTDNG